MNLVYNKKKNQDGEKTMSPTSGNYLLGKVYDPKTGSPSSEPVMFDPSNLTTHGIVIGMTGSGKTGLCISLLEEAALQGTPAIIVDPKGDLTNLLLHFPQLASRYGIHPTQINSWKRYLVEQAAELFARSNGAGKDKSSIDNLHRVIEQLTVERDFLARRLNH